MSLTVSVAALLAEMTLPEKIGQITQIEKNSLQPGDVARLHLGSVLSGGGGTPTDNTVHGWRDMVGGFLEEALHTRLKIPALYGVDAVHGHNNLRGATVFPHNIALGATGDPALAQRIAAATARELVATGVRWNFAPAVSVPQDLRWGRTFEGFSHDPTIVSEFARAIIHGLQTAPVPVAACAKHYVGDGGTTGGSSTRLTETSFDAIADPSMAAAGFSPDELRHLAAIGAWQIDQGVTPADEHALRTIHLPPYQAAIEAGVHTIMASYSSWGDTRMHAHHRLLTDVLKRELGFTGLVITDWGAVDQLHADYTEAVILALNAGIDMVMVPYDAERFIHAATQALTTGRVALARIDDAVARILTVKHHLGLFETPIVFGHPDVVGCAAHRALAREAVQRSAVLLKDGGLLPADGPVLLAGRGADNVGLQCGGWTLTWQGGATLDIPGQTLYHGLQAALGDPLQHSPTAEFSERAPVGVVVVSEDPYAEGLGDRADLTLPASELAIAERLRTQVDRLIVVVYSGRPVKLGRVADLADTVIAAWLPGSEAAALTDLLTGHVAFTGQLPLPWALA